MILNELNLILIISIIIVITIANMVYIKKRISQPFDYLINQMKNKSAIDIKQLHNNFEFEKVSQLYDELRKMQIEIESQNRQLQRDNRDFILSSIHQLKTPLSAMVMNLELLEMANKDATLEEYINQIKASIDMLNLNSEELTYLSMKDDVVYKTKRIDISEMIEKRVDFFRQIALANEKHINIAIEKNIAIDMSPIEFERLVDNNISNTIKYSNQNSEIEVSLREEDKTIILSFTSLGKEIKEPSKLFEKGYRESKNRDGHGLGLYIIKSICDKYTIDIDLQSKQGVTVFKYILQKTSNVT